MSYIKTLLVVLLTILLSSLVSYSDNSIGDIRRLYKEVNMQIESGKLIKTRIDVVSNTKVSDDFEAEMDFGGPVYEFYWASKTELKKVIVFNSNGNLSCEEEYLYDKEGQLIFSYIKSSSLLGNNTLSEERFYFTNNQLIRYVLDTGIVENGFRPEVIKSGEWRIERAAKLKKVFLSLMELN